MSAVKKINPPTSNRHSSPAYAQNVTLQTVQSQKVIDRSFTRTAGSIYRLEVILRIIGTDEETAAVEEVVADIITEVGKEIAEARAENKKLMENNGIEQTPVYDHAADLEVKIASPLVARYLNIVVELDKLVTEIDALWLSGIVSNKDRSDLNYQWQQKVMGMGARIIGVENKARATAHERGKNEEVEQEAPSATTSSDSPEPEAEKAEAEVKTDAEGKKATKGKKAAATEASKAA